MKLSFGRKRSSQTLEGVKFASKTAMVDGAIQILSGQGMIQSHLKIRNIKQLDNEESISTSLTKEIEKEMLFLYVLSNVTQAGLMQDY
jgi:uncharacterized protein YbcV (DUF1398 family)